MTTAVLPDQNPIPRRKILSGERLRLFVVLAIALAHGLLYVFLVPPWQHNDEPTHFEYAWMLAHDKPLDYFGDQEFRRVVIRSMLANNFYRNINPPNINSKDFVTLGLAQNNDRVLYYRAISLIARGLADKPLEEQLLAMRLFSLALYLLTIVAAWGATKAITPANSRLRWMVPAFLALLPGFVNVMTAVTDDVAGVFAVTLFLWAACVLISKGLSVARVAFALTACALAIAAKIIGLLTLPLLVLALAFAVFRAKWRWLPWAVLGMGLVAGLIVVFRFDDAALWLRETSQSPNTQCAAPECHAPFGKSTFRLTSLPGEPAPDLVQLLPGQSTLSLQGHTLTLGAWMWACPGDVPGCAPDPTQKFEVDSPILRDGEIGRNWSVELAISSKPQFYAFTLTLPVKFAAYTLKLAPVAKPPNEIFTVFYDGVVLVDGAFSASAPPQFEDVSAASGVWAGQQFVNLVRNPSAESAWPAIRHTVNKLGTRLVSYNPPNAILWSVLDPVASWYYILTARQMMETFWAKFGWEHVRLVFPQLYDVLAILSVFGLAGGALASIRAAKKSSGVLLVLGLAFAVMWSLAFTRGVYVSLAEKAWLPVARYTYPVIVPSALLLLAGWRFWWRAIKRVIPFITKYEPHLSHLTFFVFFVGLAALSLVSVVTFYQR